MADPNLIAILDRMQQNHTKKIKLLTTLVERLAPAPTNNQNKLQNRQNREPIWDGRLHVEIPDFSGRLKPEEFLDWTNTVEKFFEMKEVPSEKRVPLVTIHFKERAASWWQDFKFRRYLDGLPPLNNWFDLKCEMTHEFLPLNYRQSENRVCQPRHNSTSFNIISSHQHRYNISSKIVSPSPHIQQRDNTFKYLNCLPCGSQEEIFNREDEEINPFHGNKLLVACDQDDQHQPHTPSSTCFQQVDQKATTQAEECLEQTVELVDGLLMVEELQEPNDEGEANTLTDELKTKIVIVENSSNIEEDFVGDFSMFMGNLANSLSMEVRYDFLLRTKHLSLTNNEALNTNYNDPFLQPSSKPLMVEVRSSSLISRVVQRKHDNLTLIYVCAPNRTKHMCRKPNSKEVNIDLIVLHLNLYCLKEFYKEKKDSRKCKFGLYFENISLRTSFNQPGEPDAVRTKGISDSDTDINDDHSRSIHIDQEIICPT